MTEISRTESVGRRAKRLTRNIIPEALIVATRPIRRFFHSQRRFDRRFNVDTSGQIELEGLQIGNESWREGGEYLATSRRTFKRILRNLQLPYDEFDFVDIGSGKGAVLLYASEFPFKSITGVEISPTLHEVARRNIETYRARRIRCEKIVTLCIDATAYQIGQTPTAFFFANPFRGTVLTTVVRNLERSLEQRPRTVVVIYYHPLSRHSQWDEARFLRKVVVRPDYSVYMSVETRRNMVEGAGSGGSHPSYAARSVSFAEDVRPIFPAWKKCNAMFKNDTVHFGDPEWLLEFFGRERKNVHAILVEQDGKIVGVAPFLLTRMPLDFQIDGLRLGAIPLRRLRLLGGCPNIPEERAAYDALFDRIERSVTGYDAIYMECLRVDSFLWRYLKESLRVRRSFCRYCVRGPRRRPYVRFVGSFDDYMRKFSGKTRENRRREMRRLRDEGDVQLIRIDKDRDVDWFAETAATISRQTYQFRDLGLGLRDVSALKRQLRLAANRGWLRSYLLTCGGTPCCFVVGYQYNSRYYYADVGYDPAWRQFSVGTVLLLLVLEDLFNHARPEAIDFGAGGEYKSHFANENYLEADLLLVRRRPYPLLAAGLHRGFSVTSRAVSALSAKIGVKASVKRLISRSRPASEPGAVEARPKRTRDGIGMSGREAG